MATPSLPKRKPVPGALSREKFRAEPRKHPPYLSGRCPPGYFTRADLLERTGKTEQDLKRLEGRGLLKVDARNRMGWGLYTADTANRVIAFFRDRQAPENLSSRHSALSLPALSYTTEESVIVFDALHKGVVPTQIAVDYHVHPAIIELIMRDYERINSVVILTTADLTRLENLGVDAVYPVRSGDDVVQLVKAALKPSLCNACIETSAILCKNCHAKRLISHENRIRDAYELKARQAQSALPEGLGDEPEGELEGDPA